MVGDQSLFPSIALELLDKQKCIDILEEQDLILVTFVGQSQNREELNENSFIIVTKHKIHVFNDKRMEIARIDGLQIVSANLIDSMYLYIMEEYCD